MLLFNTSTKSLKTFLYKNGFTFASRLHLRTVNLNEFIVTKM